MESSEQLRPVLAAIARIEKQIAELVRSGLVGAVAYQPTNGGIGGA